MTNVKTPDYDPKNPRQDHLEFLKNCLEKGKEGIEEWNWFREEQPEETIWLQQADLQADHLERAHLWAAHLEGAYLVFAHLKGAFLQEAHLERADLIFAHLEGANLRAAHLEGANLKEAHLEGAELGAAHLEGADLSNADLRAANFRQAIIDGQALLWGVKVNHWKSEHKGYTDFAGVGLDNCRIEPRIKQLLEYNIRRSNWDEWYKDHKFLRFLVIPFWWTSDYGRSSTRIIGSFILLALLFAIIYSWFSWLAPPGIVDSLTVEPHQPLWHYGVLCVLRPVYFSIVTMTTLGFGDMYANSTSIWGHLLLTLQVLLGYFLLGALVTRFAILFTAGGPAGEFEDFEDIDIPPNEEESDTRSLQKNDE